MQQGPNQGIDISPERHSTHTFFLTMTIESPFQRHQKKLTLNTRPNSPSQVCNKVAAIQGCWIRYEEPFQPKKARDGSNGYFFRHGSGVNCVCTTKMRRSSLHPSIKFCHYGASIFDVRTEGGGRVKNTPDIHFADIGGRKIKRNCGRHLWKLP